MDKRQKEELNRLAGKFIRFGCPMAQYTTFGVGGMAEAIYEANSVPGLQKVMAYLGTEGIPYIVVGRGSNLLVKDQGIEGLVIILRGSLAVVGGKQTDLPGSTSVVRAEGEHTEEKDFTFLVGAGVSIVDLLVYCRDCGLGGLEFLAGIPGTVGGALAMNAGAYGGEIGSRVMDIQMIMPQGELVVRHRSMLRFSYRDLEMGKGSVIIRAHFKLQQETRSAVAGRVADYLKRKKENQPLEYKSAGSVFRNPPNDFAGRLIENAGLKGERIGGAMISEKHANFIVNTGDATAKDILALLYLARERVREETGIELQPEIKIVGT